ncbi:MAG: hypothetical protein AMJ46_12445 [Latescibacteria bacterium DG_63]|nr:MAG: hypothetical protein AMJ46_12445 [Latescibacteria bacterium DG_63]
MCTNLKCLHDADEHGLDQETGLCADCLGVQLMEGMDEAQRPLVDDKLRWSARRCSELLAGLGGDDIAQALAFQKDEI